MKIDYPREKYTGTREMTVRELTDFMNSKFPGGKFNDFNIRKKLPLPNVKEDFEALPFNDSDIHNFILRGTIPPRYIRANITKLRDKTINVDFFEQI